MLSDDELQALRDIERRLRWESPELVQLFNSVEPQPETNHRQRARTRVLLAAAALTGLTLLGPRMLNETEIRTQQRAPLPHTAAADTATARRTDPFRVPPRRPARSRSSTSPGAVNILSRHRPVERPDVSPRFRARAHQRVPTTKARAELERK